MLRTLALTMAAAVLSTLMIGGTAQADETPTTDGSVPGTVGGTAEASELNGVQVTEEETAGPTILVIGDSITSWYRDEPGSSSQGWWSILAHDPAVAASKITTYAEGGSGMNTRGNKCAGTTFGQRIKSIRHVDYLIIQGGRNDYGTCDSRNRRKLLTKSQQRAGIKAYFERLGDHVVKDGIAINKKHVLVVSPWGKSQRSIGDDIQYYVSRYAKREGFTYVGTKTLPTRMTIDNKHPNRAGNEYLAGTMKKSLLAAG